MLEAIGFGALDLLETKQFDNGVIMHRYAVRRNGGRSEGRLA
jgi:hypothetical protein